MYKVHEDTLIIIFKLKKFLIITIIIIMRQNAKFYSFICKSVSRVLSWIVIYLVHILLYASCHQIKEMTSSLSLLVSVLLQMGFTRLEISLFLRWALTSPFHPYLVEANSITFNLNKFKLNYNYIASPFSQKAVLSGIPVTWRLFSVALSLRLPSLDVIKHLCSMEPGLSSYAFFRICYTRLFNLQINSIVIIQ